MRPLNPLQGLREILLSYAETHNDVSSEKIQAVAAYCNCQRCSHARLTMNSLLPTDKQHDAHFAHVCVDCGTHFSKHVPKAGDCEEGDLCRDCLDAREQLTKEES